jgi:ATP-binding protein involved in chromosome partitioning
MKELKKITDPEVGIPITDMELIDDVQIDAKGNVRVSFHGSMPFCPMAAQIGTEIKDKVSRMPGVASVRVEISNHVNAEEINKKLCEV